MLPLGLEPSLLGDNHTSEDERPFPTLRQFFERVDPSLAFDIEIKYCLKRITGHYEEGLERYMERNKYADVILGEICNSSRDRKIVLTCFDPDVCTMLQLKQCRYPVLFLTQGETEKYEPYLDLRTRTVRDACHFARSQQLLGTSLHAEDLLKDPSLIEYAHQHQVVLMCWGSSCNDTAAIHKLRSSGVHGVIYDRIHELKPQ